MKMSRCLTSKTCQVGGACIVFNPPTGFLLLYVPARTVCSLRIGFSMLTRADTHAYLPPTMRCSGCTGRLVGLRRRGAESSRNDPFADSQQQQQHQEQRHLPVAHAHMVPILLQPASRVPVADLDWTVTAVLPVTPATRVTAWLRFAVHRFIAHDLCAHDQIGSRPRLHRV